LKPTAPETGPVKRFHRMVFGGLQKNSFIDYPGKISCVLFLRGCNFHCPYCHNPDLVTGDLSQTPFIKENEIFDFLKGRKSLLEGVVITGGEPTLSDDLIPICEKIRSMGFSVKLDTNGSRPEVIEQIIRLDAIDYLAMDIKTDPSRYAPLIKKHFDPAVIFESIRIIMSSGLPYEFRTTCVRPFIDEESVKRIGKIIQGARLYALQKFQNQDKVLNPEFFVGRQSCFSDREMMDLKRCAEPWVKTCIVR